LRRLAILAILAVVALAVGAAYAATADLVINTLDGTSIAVTVTPSVLTLKTDVLNPGPDWTFGSNPNGKAFPWLPSGWTTAWKYTPAGTFGCIQVDVTTYLSTWSLGAYKTVTPGTAPLEVAVNDRGTSGTCTEPTDVVGTYALGGSASPTMLAANQSGPQSRLFGLAVRATSAVSGNPVITVTFVAQ
jgi:hypothetical protein